MGRKMLLSTIWQKLNKKLATTTRKSFCQKYGLNYNTFGTTLYGSKTMSQKEAKAIAHFLGIDPQQVLQYAHDGKKVGIRLHGGTYYGSQSR